MSSIIVNYPIIGCTLNTGDVPEAVAVVLLNTHAISHSSVSSSPSTIQHASGQKLDRPTVTEGISLESNIFQRRWTDSGIDDMSAAAQLFQCSTDNLGDSLLKVDPEITSHPVTEVLAKMKALAVIQLPLVFCNQNCSN